MDAGCRQLRFQTLPGPTKGASTQLQLPFHPQLLAKLSEGCLHRRWLKHILPTGSLLLSPFLQGGLLQAGACQLLPFQPPHSDFGDSANVCCFPIPCVLRWDLSCTAEDAFGCWGSSSMGHQTNQALLCPYGHVSSLFLPCVLPVHRLRYPLAECNYPSSSPSPSSGWLLPSSEFCIVPLELATKANNNKIC